jgi:hypothetical protein
MTLPCKARSGRCSEDSVNLSPGLFSRSTLGKGGKIPLKKKQPQKTKKAVSDYGECMKICKKTLCENPWSSAPDLLPPLGLQRLGEDYRSQAACVYRLSMLLLLVITLHLMMSSIDFFYSAVVISSKRSTGKKTRRTEQPA